MEVKIPGLCDGSKLVRVVCMSDSHSLHTRLEVPPGDILLHCGDFTNKGTASEIQAFASWFAALPHPTKLLVHGNHEAGPFSKWDPRNAKSLLPGAEFVNNMLVRSHGLTIFGVPWKLQFSAHRAMPDKVDILFLHEPPKGILDGGFGCDVIAKLAKRARVVVFGHIHEAQGVVTNPNGQIFINCALANDGMVAKSLPRPPIWFDLPIVGDAQAPPQQQPKELPCLKEDDNNVQEKAPQT